ncbi:helix-turn-helix domain-containing protein [Pedobacter montanisoli]|uniref:Helix-turn-helix domain-containing protein n=1 Tax=Pedobacter montanisoli TaxID=2923277 RepID=A0ABS9ZXP5_9SPHI|nr:helix-turn-helix domain-containing protein [Pedobacter montanisoli]MCJ0743080.1 helix-turn-helix domain-containing protein [Pedobacter montanisoli]
MTLDFCFHMVENVNDKPDYFPVLDIQEFNEGRVGQDVLFHELNGERTIEKPHKHDFFMVILFGQAKGIHAIDFVEHPIANHQIHLVFPDQVHKWHIELQTMGYQLMIGRELFESISPSLRFSASYYHQHPVLNISSEIYGRLLYEFKNIQRELGEENVFEDLVNARIRIMMLLISREAEKMFRHSRTHHFNPLISKFILLVDSCFKNEHSVAFYAGKLNISSNYLNIICKKHLQLSASSLIQNRVLLEAKRLLKASNLSIKEIVYELDFYDQASFSKFFKLHTGMTPSQFRGNKMD